MHRPQPTDDARRLATDQPRRQQAPVRRRAAEVASTPLKAGPAPHGSSAEAALRTAPHGHPRTSWHLHVLVPCQVFATLSPAGRGVSPQRLVIETERVSATRGSRSRRVTWHRCVQRPDRCWFRRDDRCFPARPRARTVASESASPKRLINWSLPVGSSSDQSCWSTPDVPSARP